jgi:aryl-alcohol dehydrogenase
VVAERLAMAKEIGATHVINPKTADVVAEIMKITGTGVDFAFESTGLPAVIRNAMESLAPRGTCGIVGASSLDTEITLNAMHLMTAGRSIRGIVEGDSAPDVFIPQLIELHRQGRFPFDKLISFYSFDKINQAIEDAETGRAIKPIIRMG